MRRLAGLLVVLFALALLAPLGASAASRMYFGFQDDQNFRYAPDRQAVIQRAAATGSTVFRATVIWAEAAPTRPANAANPFDPTYRLSDVDELVRTAQAQGAEILITIWGVPGWANGGKTPNYAPKNMNDLKNFAKALASRYSGRYASYPYVRFYSVWNESNLEQFLAPQFDAKGGSVAPKTYAKLYQAAQSGIKAGNGSALVGIGEVSPRGRDKPSPGSAQDSHSPGRFMQLVAKANKKLKFDAATIHPYATTPTAKPTQKVKWPNVTLGNLNQYETNVSKWFGRKSTPIWITEYGYQTKPQRSDGVSYSTQSSYGKQAFNIAKNASYVSMFVWFIFRDSPRTVGAQWQFAGGVIDVSNNAKPAYGMFSSVSPPVDAANAIYSFKAGTKNPTIKVSALELKSGLPTGAPIGINYQILLGGKLQGNAIASASLGKDGWFSFKAALAVAKKKTYTLKITATSQTGTSVSRTIQVKST